MSQQLKDALEQHLAGVAPPPGDLVRAEREGTRRRRRRQTARAALASGLAAVVALGLVRAVDSGVESTRAPDYPPLGRLDFSEGLRAYADPGREVHLGGRTFDASQLEHLDTDAVATPSGVVFYDAGRPQLLAEDGEVRPLVAGTVDAGRGFRPTAKADSVSPQVAFATLRDDTATITVRDLRTDDDVASLEVDCGDCGEVVIDAFDDGVVLYRTGEGTYHWETGSETSDLFAGPETRVVDVRNDVLLYDGQAPTAPEAGRYLMLPAPVDAQLTHDGRWILAWSSTLAATRATDPDLVLDEGPRDQGLGFWTIDTDGSVLVAAPDGDYPRFTVFDCAVPSGRCEELGPLVARGGDPAFIGNDM